MKRKGIQIGVHMLCCLIFLSLPFFFSPDGPNDPVAFFRNKNSHRELARYALLIGFFYLNFYYLIPWLYFSKKYVGYALVVVACFGVTMAAPGMLFPVTRSVHPPPKEGRSFRVPPGENPSPGMMPLPPPEHNSVQRMPPPPGVFSDPGNNLFGNFRQHIFLFLAAFFFSLLLRIRERLLHTEKEKLQTELSYLRAQVNPHFLFNTLNSIYSLAISRSDDTANAVVKLSEMMRYILYDAENTYVPLDKELNYITDFIELQALRFGSEVPVSFSIKGNTSGLTIAPLILITFVENAFKYGVNAEEEMRIEIFIEVKDAVLLMKVHNRKVRIQAPESRGVGIENAKSRLELMYPRAHELIVMDTPADFTVSLTLQLK